MAKIHWLAFMCPWVFMSDSAATAVDARHQRWMPETLVIRSVGLHTPAGATMRAHMDQGWFLPWVHRMERASVDGPTMLAKFRVALTELQVFMQGAGGWSQGDTDCAPLQFRMFFRA